MERSAVLSKWLGDQLSASGASGFVCGLSGGIDSAVVAALCRLAAPDGTLGLIMPCHSNPADERDAEMVATAIDIRTLRVPLDDVYNRLIETADAAFAATPGLRADATDDLRARVPPANVKPRLRMTTLYLVANRLNYLVSGTGNRSEIAIGYYTKYGDGGVDLLPIGRLLKREVFELARELRLPDAIINKLPSAGLWPGQTDESEMGFTYVQLESFLVEGPQCVPEATARRIQHLIDVSAHKTALPPLPPA
jgi:NAD+ synthase